MRTIPFWEYHGIVLGVVVFLGAVIAPRTVIFSKLLFGMLGTSIATLLSTGNTPSSVPVFALIVIGAIFAPRAMLALGTAVWFRDNTALFALIVILAYFEHRFIRGFLLPNFAGYALHELGRIPPQDAAADTFTSFGEKLYWIEQVRVGIHLLLALAMPSLPFAPSSWRKYTDEILEAHKKREAAQGKSDSAQPSRNARPWWEVLGIPRTASLDDARKKFREIAKKHHPDTNKGTGDPEAMRAAIQAMNEARKEKST